MFVLNEQKIYNLRTGSKVISKCYMVVILCPAEADAKPQRFNE